MENQEGLVILQVRPAGQPANGRDFLAGVKALNLFIKFVQASGVHISSVLRFARSQHEPVGFECWTFNVDSTTAYMVEET